MSMHTYNQIFEGTFDAEDVLCRAKMLFGEQISGEIILAVTVKMLTERVEELERKLKEKESQ